MVVIKCFTLRSENQTRLIERIPAEHAAHRIGNELLDDILGEFLIARFRRILRIRECDVTLQRHTFQRHIAWHLVSHTVCVRNQLIIADLALALFLGYAVPVLTQMQYSIFQ